MPTLDDFTKHVRNFKSENTAATYTKGVKHFIGFLQQRSYAIPRLKPTVLMEFVTAMTEQGLGPSTVRLYVAATESFLTWLKDTGHYVPDHNRPKLPAMKRVRRTALTSQQLDRYFEAVLARVPEPSRTIMLLLPFTGLRITEAATLPLDALQRHADAGLCLEVIGKGSKQRTIPLAKVAEQWLKEYQRNYRRGIAASPWLFPSPDDPNRHISRHAIEHWCAVIKAEVGSIKLSPHVLRHSFATMLLGEGVNMMTIKDLLGHANIATTSIYLHPSNKDMRHAVDKLGGRNDE